VFIAAVAAAAAGLLLAVLIGSAGADTPGVTTVLGSVTGHPTVTECPATVRCTYIPFNGLQYLIAPFDGTITSFSVNSGTAGGQVELRVLSSATPPQSLNAQWTGAGTGPAETLNAGINTFAVSIPVKQGETIGLDNDSGAPIFDGTSPFAQYSSVVMYAPALPDGMTAYSNRGVTGNALLMSATLVSGTTTTTPSPPPVISHASESHSAWRVASGASRKARRRRAPVGTSFAFTLDQAATVTVELTRQLPGRWLGGACVALNRHNRGAAACTRAVGKGGLVWAGHTGTNAVPFAGRVPGMKLLAPGSYVATIIAHNAAGQASNAVGLEFTILAG
jgi:hypothetical protein